MRNFSRKSRDSRVRQRFTQEQILKLKSNILREGLLLPEDVALWICESTGARLHESIALTYSDFGILNKKIPLHQIYIHRSYKKNKDKVEGYTKTLIPRYEVISGTTERMIRRFWQQNGMPSLDSFVLADKSTPSGVIRPETVNERMEQVLGIRCTRDLRNDHCNKAIRSNPRNGVHEMTKDTGHFDDYRTKTHYARVNQEDLAEFRRSFDQFIDSTVEENIAVEEDS